MGKSDRGGKRKSRATVWVIVGLVVAAGPVISWIDTASQSRPRGPAAAVPARTMSSKGLAAQLSSAGPMGALAAAEESISARAPVAPSPVATPSAAALGGPAEGEPARVGSEGFGLTARSLAPHKSAEGAKRDAAEVAAAAIAAELRGRGFGDGGLDAQGALDQFAVRDSLRVVPLSEGDRAALEERGQESNLVKAEMRFEVRDDQLRDRRAQTRLWHAVLALAGFAVAFGGLAGYLKLDRLTKGHLSVALGAATGVAVALALAGLVSVG